MSRTLLPGVAEYLEAYRKEIDVPAGDDESSELKAGRLTRLTQEFARLGNEYIRAAKKPVFISYGHRGQVAVAYGFKPINQSATGVWYADNQLAPAVCSSWIDASVIHCIEVEA